MVVIFHDGGARKPAPADEVPSTVHKLAENNSNNIAPLTAQPKQFRKRRMVVLAPVRGHGIDEGKKAIFDDSGNAYLVDETQSDAKMIRLQSVVDPSLLQGLFEVFSDNAMPGTESRTNLGGCFAVGRTPNASGDVAPQTSPKSTPLHVHGNHTARWESEEPNDRPEVPEIELPYMRYDEIFEKFYIPAFVRIGQTCCKEIAMAWIKRCHPRKQTINPYKGGKATKPGYWTSCDHWEIGQGCRHREPAHQMMKERCFLLRHLLCYGDQFSIEKLEESTKRFSPSVSKNWYPAKIAILYEIYRVRRKEMEYEAGGIDGDAELSMRISLRKPPRGKAGTKGKAVNTARSTKKRCTPPTQKKCCRQNLKAPSALPATVTSIGFQVPVAQAECDEDRDWNVMKEAISGPTTIMSAADSADPRVPSRRSSILNERNSSKPVPVSYQAQTATADATRFHFESDPQTPFDLGPILQRNPVPDEVPGQAVYIAREPSRLHRPNAMPATDTQWHSPQPRSMAPSTSRFVDSASGITVGPNSDLGNTWNTPHTGVSGQTLRASTYPQWAETADMSFSNDYTNSAAVSFDDNFRIDTCNQAQYGILDDQNSRYLASGVDGLHTDRPYMMNARDLMNCDYTPYGENAQPPQ